MLRWTAAGAVAAPTTVQIRVQRRYPGRVRAGAPAPTRSMSPAELLKNIVHFTDGMRGPRTSPCTGLVLSGGGVATRTDLSQALTQARSRGISHIVLHISDGDLEPGLISPLAGMVDTLVLPFQPDGNADAAGEVFREARTHGVKVTTNTVLRATALQDLRQTIVRLVDLGPDAVTLTHPFPTGASAEDLAPLEEVLGALDDVVPLLDAAGVQTRLKGLPACHLGPHAARLGRTANRWYVDADHQCARALLFLPDVLSFHKDDACRFCSADPNCDGSFAQWLARPGARALEPMGPT